MALHCIQSTAVQWNQSGWVYVGVIAQQSDFTKTSGHRGIEVRGQLPA